MFAPDIVLGGQDAQTELLVLVLDISEPPEPAALPAIQHPYVIMGIMHVSSSVQIVCMAIPLKCSSPAMYRAVCSADSTFPLICCMCRGVVLLLVPIVVVLDLSLPNWIL